MTARLPTAKSGLTVAPGLLSSPAKPDAAFGRRFNPLKRLYGLKRWKDMRIAQFIKDEQRCALCGHQEKDTSLLVCDHVIPHRGDEALFWNGPKQTLCDFCHKVHKQSQEAGTSAQFHPEFLRPSVIPLTIVCGPPGAGKTTWCHAHAKSNDIIIDLDYLAQSCGAPAGKDWDRDKFLAPALRKRNAMLLYLSRDVCRFRSAWFIVTEPEGRMRQWWNDKMKPNEIVLVMPNAIICKERLPEARRPKVNQWFLKYSPRQGDVVLPLAVAPRPSP